MEKAESSGHRIMLVDDHEGTVRVLESLLSQLGYELVTSTTDPRQVASLFESARPDAMLLDLHMPGLDGVEVMREIQSLIPSEEFLPIVMISGDLTIESRERALTAGATDFILKPVIASEVALRLRNLLRLRDLTCRLEEQVRERVNELRQSEMDMARRLAAVSEYRDYPDGAHVHRVGRVSALIAEMLGRPLDEVMLIRHAAPLHDIGKVALPDAILLKPAALTAQETDVVKGHTTAGARMLAGSASPVLQMAEEIALYHHENWDGSGYTPDVGGDDIPLVGRIVSVADVYDALTHPRPYQPPRTSNEAVSLMQTMRGRKFDPIVLDALMAVLGESCDGAETGLREPAMLTLPLPGSRSSRVHGSKPETMH